MVHILYHIALLTFCCHIRYKVFNVTGKGVCPKKGGGAGGGGLGNNEKGLGLGVSIELELLLHTYACSLVHNVV